MDREKIFTLLEDNIREKRKYVRYPYCYKIRKCMPDSKSPIVGFTNNISFSGLQFNSNQKHSKNDSFEVLIEDPRVEDSLFRLKVRVVWSEEAESSDNLYTIGVSFSEYSNKQHEYIFKVMSDYIGVKYKNNYKKISKGLVLQQLKEEEEYRAERREYKRFPYNCHVCKQREGQKDWIDGFICEISCSGLQILCSKPYESGEFINIEFQDPVFDELKDMFKAEVMWCKQSMLLKEMNIIGLQFKDCTKEQKDFLFSLVSDSIVKRRK
ncbi:hypothetical protein BVX93_02155 [bacterium B13(2017)]|nr:hypothetical protein BVX93_02155 [bacterium B13(2017)]